MDDTRKQALEQLIADGGPVPATIEPAHPASTGLEVGDGNVTRLVTASRFAWRNADGDLEVANSGDTVKVDTKTAKRGEDLGVLAPTKTAGAAEQTAGNLEDLADGLGLDLAPGAPKGQDDEGIALTVPAGDEADAGKKAPKAGK